MSAASVGAARRVVRPYPVLRLALPVLRLRRHRRGGGTRQALPHRAFLEAVLREIELRADALDARRRVRPPLASVYLGGGTPSLLPADDVERLLARVRERFGIAATPRSPSRPTRGRTSAVTRLPSGAAGVTRMSFGAQSFDDTELRTPRSSPPRSPRRRRRRRGTRGRHRTVNVDLLYDIPDADLPTWMATLDAAVDLGTDHLSLYGLALDDPDAEGLTTPDGDHLPVSKGARRWREGVRPGRTRTARRPSTTTPS